MQDAGFFLHSPGLKVFNAAQAMQEFYYRRAEDDPTGTPFVIWDDGLYGPLGDVVGSSPLPPRHWLSLWELGGWSMESGGDRIEYQTPLFGQKAFLDQDGARFGVMKTNSGGHAVYLNPTTWVETRGAGPRAEIVDNGARVVLTLREMWRPEESRLLTQLMRAFPKPAWTAESEGVRGRFAFVDLDRAYGHLELVLAIAAVFM